MDDADGVAPLRDSELPEGTWPVGKLNEEIEAVLNDAHTRFPTHVVGEVAEVDEYDFGTFFELRDLDEQPVISCLAWSYTLEDIEHELEEGTEAIVEASVDFYPDRGDCQLLVTGYWPLGESHRQQQLDALRSELAEEGLFDEERKQQLPPYPGCLGLVTSPSGSAREDTWAAISERSPRTEVRLCGATVQGDEAVSSLITSIQFLDSDPEVETIIVTRGGGSDVDLWCFNAEPLLRTIASCSTPVLVAIGHEDDETLVEYVADERAMTPTEAGVIATPEIEHLGDDLSIVQQRIENSYNTLVNERLDGLERQITTAYEALEQRVAQQDSLRQRSRDLERRVTIGYETLVEKRLEILDTRIERAVKEVELAAESEATSAQIARGRLKDLEGRIDVAYDTLVNRKLEQYDRRIESAYRDIETAERVQAGTAEARRLRIVVAILLGLILLGGLALVFFVL